MGSSAADRRTPQTPLRREVAVKPRPANPFRNRRMTTNTITIPNSHVLDMARRLASVKSTNGLTAVKLHKIRKALAEEGAAIVAAFEEIDKQHALVDDAGAARVQEEGLARLSWSSTGTPAYLVDPGKADARTAALAELDAGVAAIVAPQLTESDLASITAADEAGPALDAFSAPL